MLTFSNSMRGNIVETNCPRVIALHFSLFCWSFLELADALLSFLLLFTDEFAFLSEVAIAVNTRAPYS